jgi:uncharacterized protein YcfJ
MKPVSKGCLLTAPKRCVALLGLASAAALAQGMPPQAVPAQPVTPPGVALPAQAVGQVISSTPILQPVTVARQTCTPGTAAVQTPPSGAGAIMGAIAGGAVGSNIGSGAGAALATGIGVVAGAMMGDRIEGSGTRTVPTQSCTTQNVLEYRVQGYTVVYDYQGRQYTSQMQFDPGRTVALQFVTINPVNPGEAAATVPVPAPAQPAQPFPPVAQLAPPLGATQPSPQVITPGAAVVWPQTTVPQVVAPQVVVTSPNVVYAPPTVVYTDPWWPPVGYSSSVFIGSGWRGGGYYRGGWGPGYWGPRSSISIGVSRGWGWRGW